MSSTTKNDLVLDAAKLSGLAQIHCAETLEAMLKVIVEVLVIDPGTRVEIRGFGTFYLRRRKARPARNPKTKAIVMLPVRRVMLWRPTIGVKLLVKEGSEEP